MVKRKTTKSKKVESCIIIAKSLKRQLKERAAREERDMSSIIGDASKMYLKEKREQEREDRETRKVEREEKALQSA
jgi:hypothetical protein